MSRPGEETWLDADAGRLVRPYLASNGRTSPSVRLDLLAMVLATGEVPASRLEPDHAQALALCTQPSSIAEIAARLRLPAAVAKVLVADLVDCGAVTTRMPYAITGPDDRILLERVLDALQHGL